MNLREKMKNSCCESVKRTDKYRLFLFATIVLIRTIFTSRIDTATGITGADEIGTIASAAYFAGYDWSGVMSNTLYYGFGYSMLLAPIFLIFRDPATIHHMLLFSNNIVIAMCAVLIYTILVKFLKLEDKRVAISIAAMVVLYFPLSYIGNALINESMLQLIVWVVLYLLLCLNGFERGRKRNIGTVVLGAVLFYSLLVHSRSIVLIAVVVVIVLVTYIITKKNIVNGYIFYPLLAIGYFLSKIIVKIVQGRLWLSDGNEVLTNSTESLFSALFGNLELLCTYDGIKGYLSELIGQIYSMTVLTYGIFAIVCVTIVIFLKNIWKEKKYGDNCSVNIAIAVMFGVIGGIVTLLSSSLVALKVVLANSENNIASKWFLYSRYWSIYISVLIMLGGFLLYQYRKQARGIIASSLNFILLVAFAFNGYLGYKYSGQGFNQTGVYYPFMAIGFLSAEGTMTDTSFFKITLIFLLVFCFFILLILKKKTILAYSFLCMVMFANYAYGTYNLQIKVSDALSAHFDEMIEIVEDAEYNTEHIYISNYSKFSLWLQYCFPRYEVVCNAEDIEEKNAIVVTNRLTEEFLYGDWSVVYHGDIEELQYEDLYMLVRGDELKESLSNKGYEIKQIDLLELTGYFIKPNDDPDETKLLGAIINDSLEQHFEVTKEMETSDFQLEIKMATYARENQGTIRIEVIQDDKVLTYDVNKPDIVDNDWLQINVCNHALSSGDAIIRITDLDNDIDNCVTAYLVDSMQLGQLQFGDTKMDEKLYMRIKKLN